MGGVMVSGDGGRAAQLGLGLGLGPVVGAARLFWCCGDCWGEHEGRVSLTWLPPDQKRGRCHWCGEVYEFGSGYGFEELVAAGGRVREWEGWEN